MSDIVIPAKLSLAPWRERIANLLKSATLQQHLATVSSALSAMTPLGWGAIVGGVIALTLGLVYAWLELVIIGIALLALLVIALAWTMGKAAYEADLELDRPRIQQGDTAYGRVVLTSRRRRSWLPARIELPVGKAVAGFHVPILGADSVHEELFSIPGRRRSVVTVGPVLSVRADPVGIVRRTRAWSQSRTLYIHPATVAIAGTHSGFLKDIEGVASSALSQSDMAFHALRDYVPGDDRRAVHWRTSARVGRLVVRQFEETRRAHLLIVLSLDPASYANPDQFELAVSAAGSMAKLAASENRKVSLVSDRGLERAPGITGLLDSLSGISLAERPIGLTNAVTAAWQAVPEASVAAFIVGSASDPVGMRAARLRLPDDVPTCAIRCGTAAVGRRDLGTLTMLDVPDLASLPAALGGWR